MESVTPEEVGLSTARLERLHSAMQGFVDRSELAGVLTMIVRRGKIAHFEPFGLMDIEAGKSMEFDTIFRIFSMTKLITSVAVLMLYEEGHFQLNDPVSRFIPEFKDVKVFANAKGEDIELVGLEREMTVRNLLTHTSGLTNCPFAELPNESTVEKLYQEADLLNPDLILRQMVHRLVRQPLLHQPDTVWQYGVSTDVLGYLVEVVSGLPFDRFLQERILDPLGMVDTGFYLPEEKLGRLAAIYEPSGDGRLKAVDTPTGFIYSVPITNPPLRRQRLLSGGGGLLSTTVDYLRFAQMLLNRGALAGTRLLGRKTVELMTMNHLREEVRATSPMTDGNGFGLGVRVCTDVALSGVLGSLGEYGWGGSAHTVCWIDPHEELIGLLMTQVMSPVVTVREDFRVLTYQAIVD